MLSIAETLNLCNLCNIFTAGLFATWEMLHPQRVEEPSPGSMEVTGAGDLASSPQSEAVTSELQELSIEPADNSLPLQERKNGKTMKHTFFFPGGLVREVVTHVKLKLKKPTIHELRQV